MLFDACIHCKHIVIVGNRYLDLLNLMAYDFHGTWEIYIDHAAPLYSAQRESEESRTSNVVSRYFSYAAANINN